VTTHCLTHLTIPSTAAPSTSSSVGTWRGGVLVPVGQESSIRYRIYVGRGQWQVLVQ
jgi:hypothetical protein